MPPKSSNKKSAASTGAASWYHCEACNAHITANERETHERVCPIEEGAIKRADSEASLEYIRNGALYTASVERRSFVVKELNDLPLKYVNYFLFMSEGAMRLAGLHIGQEVVLHVPARSDIVPIVRELWPIPEKFLTTLFVNDEDYKLLRDCVVCVESLPKGAVMPATTAQFQLVALDDEASGFNQEQLQNLATILKHEIKHKIFTRGSCIKLEFFNQTLELTSQDWTSLPNVAAKKEQDLAQRFKRLSLGSGKATPKLFSITARTHIEVKQAAAQIYDEARALSPQFEPVTMADIGGLDEELAYVVECMEFALGLREPPKAIKPTRCLLLYGATGCGKTLICQAVCSLLQQLQTKTHILRINGSEIFSKFLGESERNLLQQFESAYANYPEPTLIIVEDVHSLCPKQDTNEVTKRVAAAFLSALDALNSRREAQNVFLLATTSRIEALNAGLRRCGRMDCELEIGAPSPHERAEIIRCMLRDVEHELTELDVEEIARVTHGFVGADLANLLSHASLLALKSDNQLCALHIDASLLHVKPSAMREVLIECPNVRWSDIGGQAELQLKLKQAIEWPLLHAHKFKELGIKPPRGLLMFGPPGCSKTMIAKALATESQLNFLSIKGPELFSMWVGESERAVRDVFRKARQVAPSIVFFDEIDAIGGERADGAAGGSGSSVKERVLTQLLTELDGVESLQNVTIVAATNRPDMIDAALLRPGRIDRIIYVGLPDALARHEIFEIKLRKMPIAKDVNIDELVKRTDGYSGAEIQAVCHEAALNALEQSFDAVNVGWAHFEYGLKAVQPRTSPDLLRIYDEYLAKNQ